MFPDSVVLAYPDSGPFRAGPPILALEFGAFSSDLYTPDLRISSCNLLSFSRLFDGINSVCLRFLIRLWSNKHHKITSNVGLVRTQGRCVCIYIYMCVLLGFSLGLTLICPKLKQTQGPTPPQSMDYTAMLRRLF